MIIDTHMHAFPFLGSGKEAGWASAKERVANWQTLIYGFARGKPVEERGSASSLPDINFRVGEMGRFEWTEDGQDYYFQFMPPSMQNQIASPKFVLTQLDHAGVDLAVLQNAKSYGKLNEYFSAAVKQYPDRFIGLLEIDELAANQEDEINRLRHAAQELGLNGIYYEADRFYAPSCADLFSDSKFDNFWQTVYQLDIPVYWSLLSPRLSADEYMRRMRDFEKWVSKFPTIRSVVVMGLMALPFLQSDGSIEFPKELYDIGVRTQAYFEITYPIQVGPLGWDYPYVESRQLIQKQYDIIGPNRLLWGSDMPNVERNCTYPQTLNFLKDYCDFIPGPDMDLILGGNAIELHKINTDIKKSPRPQPAAVA